MKIISFLNQKGGVGKTTTSTNIAHAFTMSGKKVLLVDSDPQGSARNWNEESEGRFFPVIGIDRKTLDRDIKAVSSDFDLIIIDGAPQLIGLSASALKVSDLVIIPVQPSPYDIWSTDSLVDAIKTRQSLLDGNPMARFLISRQIKNTNLSKEIKEALEPFDLPVLHNHTTQRVVYASQAVKGETVLTSQDKSAILEIQNIKEEIEELL